MALRGLGNVSGGAVMHGGMSKQLRSNPLLLPGCVGSDRAMDNLGGSITVASTIDSWLLAGQLIGGRYRVSHLLGEGGMASVWACSNERTGKLVALKVIRRSFMATPGAEGFLQSEGLAASRINHPNVVSVFDIIEHEGAACIVMELLDGLALGTYIARNKPLSLIDTAGILLPAMRGVASAHAHGVIHRDLKPQNVFVCVDADGRVVTTKVLDFGISMMMDWARGQSVAAMPGLVGTPSYMAPEHIEGHTELDPRTDVYGFGLLLYESLSGTPAFPMGNSVDDVLHRVLTELPVPLRELRPDLPLAFLNIVETAIAKRADQRFKTLNHMMWAIEEQMADLPKTAGRETSAPIALMSYTVSGSQSVGVPLLTGRESSEPYTTQNYGRAKREGDRPASSTETADEARRKLLTAVKTPGVGEATPNPETAKRGPPVAPTVLLARSIISRGVRDWRNHHYVRSLREHRWLRIVAVAGLALVFLLAVWGIARERGGAKPSLHKPGATASPSRPSVVPLPSAPKPGESRYEIVPLGNPPAPSAVESALPHQSEPKSPKGRTAGDRGAERNATAGKREPRGEGAGAKSRAGADNQVTRRAGGLKVDDF
jgi:serine/threonine protein kinase